MDRDERDSRLFPDQHARRDDIQQPGGHLYVHVPTAQPVDDVGQIVALERRRRYQHRVDVALVQHAPDVRHISEAGHAVPSVNALGARADQTSDGLEARRRVPAKHVDDVPGLGVRADDQRRAQHRPAPAQTSERGANRGPAEDHERDAEAPGEYGPTARQAWQPHEVRGQDEPDHAKGKPADDPLVLAGSPEHAVEVIQALEVQRNDPDAGDDHRQVEERDRLRGGEHSSDVSDPAEANEGRRLRREAQHQDVGCQQRNDDAQTPTRTRSEMRTAPLSAIPLLNPAMHNRTRALADSPRIVRRAIRTTGSRSRPDALQAPVEDPICIGLTPHEPAAKSESRAKERPAPVVWNWSGGLSLGYWVWIRLGLGE